MRGKIHLQFEDLYLGEMNMRYFHAEVDTGDNIVPLEIPGNTVGDAMKIIEFAADQLGGRVRKISEEVTP